MNWEDFSANKNSDDVTTHKEFIGGIHEDVLLRRMGAGRVQGGMMNLSIRGVVKQDPAEAAHQRAMNLSAEEGTIPTLTRQNVEVINQAAVAQAQANIEAMDRRQAAKGLLQLHQGKPSVSYGGRAMRIF